LCVQWSKAQPCRRLCYPTYPSHFILLPDAVSTTEAAYGRWLRAWL
jgi:hypothetical protein